MSIDAEAIRASVCLRIGSETREEVLQMLADCKDSLGACVDI